ncbi:MAG: hypothetical protein ACYTFV_09175 [Planctomycetota bacterium]|jgi:hypothetical protein
MRRVLTRFLLVAGSTFLAFVCLEAWARTLDPFGISYWREVPRYLQTAIDPAPLGPDGLPFPNGRIFQNKAGVELDYRRFDFITNQMGLRDDDPLATVLPRASSDAGRDGQRWLFLGDSVTLGWGVDDADTWVRRVERSVVGPEGEPVEALNAGHLMYETVQQADLLGVLGPTLEPDVVALCFISNDFEPTYDQIVDQVREHESKVAEREARGPLVRAGAWVSERFYGLAGVFRYLREQSSAPTDHSSEHGPMRFYPENWPRCRDALNDIVARCEAIGARFVLIDHTIPSIPELPAWASERGQDYVRVGFDAADYARGITNSAVDSHANALGNAIIAERVIDGLVELGCVERR